MAANTLPSGIGDLFLLADRIEAGLKLYGPWVLKGGITAEEFAVVQRDAQAGEAAFATSRAAKASAGQRFAAADQALTSWLAKARLVVMLAYGSQWSESWLATGFTHRGTNVPKRIGPRIELARRLAQFFTDLPEYEVPFAAVTARDARALHQEITAAEQEVRRATTQATEMKRKRDAAEKRLRRQMRRVRLFLCVALKKNDPRWQAFGLKVPNPSAQPQRLRYEATTDAVQIDFAPPAPAVAAETAAA